MQNFEVKKLGAISQAKCLDIVFQILKDSDIAEGLKEIQDGNTSVETVAKVVGAVVHDHFQDIADIITTATTLTQSDLEADGDDSIDLQDVVEVLKMIAEKNELNKILERLGNAPTPPIRAAKQAHRGHL